MAKGKSVHIAYHPVSDTLDIFFALHQPTIADEVRRDVFVHYHVDHPNQIVGFTFLHFMAHANQVVRPKAQTKDAAKWRIPVTIDALAALQYVG